jgi:hypothetical protein
MADVSAAGDRKLRVFISFDRIIGAGLIGAARQDVPSSHHIA